MKTAHHVLHIVGSRGAEARLKASGILRDGPVVVWRDSLVECPICLPSKLAEQVAQVRSAYFAERYGLERDAIYRGIIERETALVELGAQASIHIVAGSVQFKWKRCSQDFQRNSR